MTKDADKFICICYHDYLERINSGSSKTKAKCFSDNYKSENNSFASWHEDDFSSTVMELSKSGYLKVYLSDSFELTPLAIEYMENRFKNNLKELTEFISKFIP